MLKQDPIKLNMELGGEEMKKSGSRFQVARVNTRDEQGSEGDYLEQGDTADDKNDPVSRGKNHGDLENIDSNVANSTIGGRGSISNGPESPCATFSISGDSIRSRGSFDVYTKTNYAMNTIEALPCVDHYRNIFSATGGGVKVRPTLAELHEELVR